MIRAVSFQHHTSLIEQWRQLVQGRVCVKSSPFWIQDVRYWLKILFSEGGDEVFIETQLVQQNLQQQQE